MKLSVLSLFFVVFIVSIGFVAADIASDDMVRCSDGSFATNERLCPTTSSDVDTIDAASEEKERALSAISNSISAIQSSLERCDSDVCRQVSANADKRHELIVQAQRDMDNAARYLTQIQSIVREDIAALERCDSDVCRAVLDEEKNIIILIDSNIDLFVTGEDLDSDGDGIPDVVERGEQVFLDGSSSFEIFKVADADSVMYKVFAGAGAGRVSLQSFKHVACPQERCEEPVSIEVIVRNTPPVAATISPDIFAYDTHLSVDERGVVEFKLPGAVCSQRGEAIHCRYGDESAVFSFARGVEVSCTTRGDTLWCWGQNRAGEETQVQFSTGLDDVVEADNRTTDVSGEIVLEEGREMRREEDNNDVQTRSGPPDTITYQGRITGLSQGVSPRDLNDSDKEDLGEYLRNRSELQGADFGLAVAYAASGNEQVRNVRYNNETDEVEVDHVENVRLFGFIPVQANARSSVRADGEVRTQLPWWSRLATRSANSTDWMRSERIADALDVDDDGDGVPTGQGEEVDILGMGEEKVTNGADDNQTTETRTGRNPQTGKEIQIAAKTVDKSTPALAKASAHVREGDEVTPVELSLQTRSFPLSDGDELVCGELADGTSSCEVSRGSDSTIWCWGNNERSLSEDACPVASERGNGLEIAVERVERGHPGPSNSPFEVLDVVAVDETAVLLVVHTGDVPSEQEVAMNKAELIEAMASNAGISSRAASGYVQISGTQGVCRSDDSLSCQRPQFDEGSYVPGSDGLYVNLQDFSLESNSLVFVTVDTLDIVVLVPARAGISQAEGNGSGRFGYSIEEGKKL